MGLGAGCFFLLGGPLGVKSSEGLCPVVSSRELSLAIGPVLGSVLLVIGYSSLAESGLE